MEKPYSVGMIGCGRRGQSHAPGLAAEPRCRVVALSDPNAEAAGEMNRKNDFAAEIFADHRHMLEQVKPDVVVASLWTPLHLSIIRDCAEAGVRAVLSEKPMAPTWGDCLRIAQVAERTGCQVTFSHQRRFAEGNRLARNLLVDGVFGEPQRLDLYSPQNLLDCGTHTFDQALSFLGERSAKWVLGAVDASKTLNWFDVRSETVAVGTVVFEGGVRANFQVGGPDMDIWGGVRFHGSRGFFAVNWDGEFQAAVVYGEPDWQLPSRPSRDEVGQMTGVVKDAIDALESGGEPELSYKKALRASEIIFALYESVRRRARVELPLEGVEGNPLHDLLMQSASDRAQ